MDNQKFLDTKGVEYLWSKITPEAIGAMPADYTHRELVAKDKIGTVILGNEKQNETTNYYLRPFNKQEGEAYYLGTKSTPWDRLYTKSAVIPGNLYIGHIDGENVTEDQHNIYIKRKKKDSDDLLSARIYWSNNDDYTKYNLRLNAALNGTVYNTLILGDSETSFGKPVAISGGGTGASTAADARAKLGITPANIGAAASDHTHRDLTANSGNGIVRVGYQSSNGIISYYLRPNKSEGSTDLYVLGSKDNHWDKAYVDKIILSDGSEAVSESWVLEQIGYVSDVLAAWEAKY